MDFIHDQLADGTAIRMPSIVDLYTHDCVGRVPAMRLRSDNVVTTPSRMRNDRKIPAVILCDNGAEFTAVALDYWC